MSASQGRVNRPYRKASEYLVASNKAPVADGIQSQLSHENEILNQKVLVATRKLERAEAEFAQSREYFESQLDLSQDREFKINEQYRRLQSSYGSLQASTRELEHRISKVNQVEAEKNILIREVNELSNKLTETRNALMRMQEENERLRKDCNTAVQLLKCNQVSYQVKRPEQLPEDIQDQVNTYKVELQNYNEYINPYADASDSGSDDGQAQVARFKKPPTRKVEDNGVPVEFIAEALKKPENVHLNLEPSDYIKDPSLHSVYKAHYVERKLIRPDYGQKEKMASASAGEAPRYHAESNRNHKQASAGESSPWELAPSRHGVPRYESNPDDESPAGAYGAYSVGPKRKARPRSVQAKPSHSEKPFTSYDEREAYPAPPRSASPEELSFRTSSQPAKTGMSSYFTKSSKSSPSISTSSGSSSKKSTPIKVRGKEAATSAETSSLLNQSESDDDDGPMVEISHSQNSSPEKRYKKEKIGDEGGALLASEEDPVDLPPPPSEIELEWDAEIDLDDTIVEKTSQELEEFANQVEKLEVKEQESVPHSDLLLSYHNVESPKTSITGDLEELISSPEHESFLSLDNQEFLPPPNPTGQLLSEIVINNPSLSNFLMTSAPPPPQEFASTNGSLEVKPVYVLPSQYHAPPGSQPEMSIPGIDEPELSQPIRVDEQIEVIDLDEEPKKRINRRRNSFDHAQEYGNILNL